jgi:hypothetical protein
MSVKLNTRLTDNDRHQLSAKADSILEKRKVLAVEPWGTSPHRYYMKLLPTDLRAAIELINLKMEGKFSNALHTDSDASVVLCDAEHSKVGNIQFMWKGQHPCVASSWNDAGALTISERHPAYHELLTFAKRCAELDAERSYGLKLVKHIANHTTHMVRYTGYGLTCCQQWAGRKSQQQRDSNVSLNCQSILTLIWSCSSVMG